MFDLEAAATHDAPNDIPSLRHRLVNEAASRPRRYTLCLTLRCNLACSYCYIGKNPATMSLDTARRSLDFIFEHAPSTAAIEIGFFGGEPLLEFSLLKTIVAMVEQHPAFDPERVSFTLTTNGTIFSDAIAAFFRDHAFKVCISCDGAPHVQNLFRRTLADRDTAGIVERNLIAARAALPNLLVNAVYHPQTFHFLPESLDYFSDLGLRLIFLNPDYSARWTFADARMLPQVYHALGDRYVDWYRHGDPHFVSLIDTKIAVLVRGGYHPLERCQMGTGELAVAPDGGLYPCERLVGNGTDENYRIGTVEHGFEMSRLAAHCAPGSSLNEECLDCSLKDSCMNWCGCSNAFMTGYYNRIGPFLCASERAAIQVALDVFTTLERECGPIFLHHLAGAPHWNVQVDQKGAGQPSR